MDGTEITEKSHQTESFSSFVGTGARSLDVWMASAVPRDRICFDVQVDAARKLPSQSRLVMMMMKLSARYKLATLAFECSANPNNNDTFGANGLPLTPPSITMVGNFHSFVRSFNAAEQLVPYLTSYLDCIRSKNERISVVFEHYPITVTAADLDLESILKCGLYGLYHLHNVIGATHGLVSPGAFLLTGDPKCPVKLAHWAINIITNFGELCRSQIYPDDIRFMAPEQCLTLLTMKPIKKSDIWSLGLTILFLMFPDSQCKFPDDPREFAVRSFEQILSLLDIDRQSLSDRWIKFFDATLQIDPAKRATINKLIQMMQLPLPQYPRGCSKFQRLASLEYTNVDDVPEEEFFKIHNFMDIYEFYYLWTILYPSKEMDKEQKKIPAILSIPRLLILENEFSLSVDHYFDDANGGDPGPNSSDFLQRILSMNLDDLKLFRLPSNDRLKCLPVETINERLMKLSNEIFAPVLTCTDLFQPPSSHHGAWCNSNNSSSQSCESLPLPIREMDFDYQCQRLFLFKALLNGYPFLRHQLIREAKVDICPHYRAQIWCSLLNVRWRDRLLYERIDKMSATATDRQIAVDIPRCHQYNELLASAEGHRKLTRVLKAWLAHNEHNEQVYWQGLDSLAAPFVILNFNNEPQAFSCFQHFIQKYLHGFFKKDNSLAIQEYLALFQICITFHDPVLSNHLAELKFPPDLYAISWFLTMFTHILPLYQIFQLWDTLILGNESFPLFIGLAILHQLRDRILDFTFNDCILIFSDLPQIDIDRCVRNSVKFSRATPKTISQRNSWPIDSLKQQPRLPRIKLEDLVTLHQQQRRPAESALDTDEIDGNREWTGIVILDCRSKEDLAKQGTITNAMKYEDFCQELQTSSSTETLSTKVKKGQCLKHDLVVVVNSIDKTMELIEKYCIPHVCYLEIFSSVPKSLQQS